MDKQCQQNSAEMELNETCFNDILYEMWQTREECGHDWQTHADVKDGLPAKVLSETYGEWVPACVSPPRYQLAATEVVAHYLLPDAGLCRKRMPTNSSKLIIFAWRFQQIHPGILFAWRHMNDFRRMHLSMDREQRNDVIYIMYHGTSNLRAAKIRQEGFRQSEDGLLGKGVYLTRHMKHAMDFAYTACHDIEHAMPEILRCEVKVGTNIQIFHCGDEKRKTWHFFGYDTANMLVREGHTESCVWDPRRIQVKNSSFQKRVVVAM